MSNTIEIANVVVRQVLDKEDICFEKDKIVVEDEVKILVRGS